MTSSEHFLIAERTKYMALWMQADFDRFKLLKRIAHAEEAGRRPPRATRTALTGLEIRIRDMETKLQLIQAAYLALVDPDGTQRESREEDNAKRAPGAPGYSHRRPDY